MYPSFLKKAVLFSSIILFFAGLFYAPVDGWAKKKRGRARTSAPVETPSSSVPKSESSVSERLNALSTSLKGAEVGLCVFDLEGQKEIFAKNADNKFSLASNQKVLTTAAALETLGYDYRYSTKMYSRGVLNAKGVLEGDLIIVGSGDPGFSPHFYPEGGPTAIFDFWAQELKKRGLNAVTGAVLVDVSLFDEKLLPDSYPKNQLNWWYTAQSSALAFNDNCVDLTIKPGKTPGAPAVVICYPQTAYVNVVNNAVTGTAGDKSKLLMTRKPDTNYISITGKINLNTTEITESITVHQPYLFAGFVLKERFQAIGINMSGEVKKNEGPFDPKRADVKLLAEHQTPLLDIARVCNKRSQNHYAEQILRTMGAAQKGLGSFENGCEAVRKFITEKLQLPADGLEVEDGSGLSRGNKFTPRGMVTLLNYMYRKGDVFRTTLSVAGVDQSMRKRLKDPMFLEKVWAKSGYINNVSTFSGYLKAKSGKMIAFSILINKSRYSNTNNIDLQDKVCAELMNGL